MTQHHWQILDSGSIEVSSTPLGLWKDACKYFLWCDENPIKKKSKIKSGKGAGTEITEDLPRAYSLKALCLHCGIEDEWIRDIRETKRTDSEYYNVVNRILYVIYCQQYELAAVGELNPVFITKALNMDNVQQSNAAIKVEIIGDLPPLSRTENEILEKLELENSIQQKREI